VQISLPDGGQVILINLTMADLSADDFEFSAPPSPATTALIAPAFLGAAPVDVLNVADDEMHAVHDKTDLAGLTSISDYEFQVPPIQNPEHFRLDEFNSTTIDPRSLEEIVPLTESFANQSGLIDDPMPTLGNEMSEADSWQAVFAIDSPSSDLFDILPQSSEPNVYVQVQEILSANSEFTHTEPLLDSVADYAIEY